MTQDVAEMLDVVMVQIPWLFVVWMIGVGGAIGSFLNVVVYRIPARISISHPPSHCPRCEFPIRIYDNVPVIGWLMLRGKCRNCKLPIAIRYPIVEASVALLFGILAFATVSSVPGDAGVIHEFFQFVFYANAVACLMVFALIDFDGHVFPGRLVSYAVLTVLIPPVFRDDLRIWALPEPIRELPIASMWAGGALIVVTHAIGATLVAFIASWRMRLPVNFIVCSSFVGVLIGSFVSLLPLIIVSRVFGALFERMGLCRTSPVAALALLTYLVVVVQFYRGDVFHYF